MSTQPSTQRRASRKEVSEALGISKQRLSVLIQEGRIRELPGGGFDLEQARQEYVSSLDPAKRALWEARNPAARPVTASAPSSVVSDAPARPRAEPPATSSSGATSVRDDETGEIFDFSHARTKKEMANARRAELDYAVKKGLYLSRDEVSAKEFAIARKLRDRILAFPPKLATMLPPEAMQTIVDECEQLVRELQDDVASIAEAG